jgi:hypothetical protein
VVVQYALRVANRSGAHARLRQVIAWSAGGDAEYGQPLALCAGGAEEALAWRSVAGGVAGGLLLQLSRGDGDDWSAPFDPFDCLAAAAVDEPAEAEPDELPDAEDDAPLSPAAAAAAALARLRSGGAEAEEASRRRSVALPGRAGGLDWLQLRLHAASCGGARLVITAQPPPLALCNASAAPLRFRPEGGGGAWVDLAPFSSAHYTATDALAAGGGALRVCVAGGESSGGELYSLAAADGRPLPRLALPAGGALRASLARDAAPQVLHFSEVCSGALSSAAAAAAAASASAVWTYSFAAPTLTLSLVDVGGVGGSPEEVALLSVDGVAWERGAAEALPGGGPPLTRTQLRLGSLQLDDMVPGSPYRVIAHALPRTKRGVHGGDFFCLTREQGPDAAAALEGGGGELVHLLALRFTAADVYINISEPTARRVAALVAAAGEAAEALSSILPPPPRTAAAPPPPPRLLLLRSSRLKLRFSLRSGGGGATGGGGLLASLGAAAANLDETLFILSPVERRPAGGLPLRGSGDVAALLGAEARRQLRRQLYRVLHGVDVLHSVSSVFGAASARVASLSADSTFEAWRAAARAPDGGRPRVAGVSDGLRDGTEALARGVFNGVRGLVSKPLDGAKRGGVRGFVKGVGRGLLGVATQPVSGALDLAAAAAEGVRATAGMLTEDEASRVRRRRLPRHVRADGSLAPYDDALARGAAALRSVSGAGAATGGSAGGGALSLATAAAGAVTGLLFRARAAAGGSFEAFSGSVAPVAAASWPKLEAMVTSRRFLLLQRPDGGGASVGGRLATLIRREGTAASAAVAAERAEAAAAEEPCTCVLAVDLSDVLRTRIAGAELALELRGASPVTIRCAGGGVAAARLEELLAAAMHQEYSASLMT